MVPTDCPETSITLGNIPEDHRYQVHSDGTLISGECWQLRQLEATARLQPFNVIYLRRGHVINTIAMYSRCPGLIFMPKVWWNWVGILGFFSWDLAGRFCTVTRTSQIAALCASVLSVSHILWLGALRSDTAATFGAAGLEIANYEKCACM
jgi:hypothetical protein